MIRLYFISLLILLNTVSLFAQKLLTLITDGVHDKDFATQYLVVDKTCSVNVSIFHRGGFAASITPIQQ